MEIVIFIGMQASGKSTYFKEHFFMTHIRVNLDMLKTRNKERILIEACMKAKQSFVVDNTNPTVEDRRGYIEAAKEAGVKVVGYYFQSDIAECIERNNARIDKEKVPVIALRRTHSKLQLPTYDEGFDELYHVKISETNEFVVEEWSLLPRTRP
ncbi:MAG TPA: ATP-binding protein [Clostridia bacterium]|nr:ATP-binding protein [Clostridia bacterium]